MWLTWARREFLIHQLHLEPFVNEMTLANTFCAAFGTVFVGLLRKHIIEDGVVLDVSFRFFLSLMSRRHL